MDTNLPAAVGDPLYARVAGNNQAHEGHTQYLSFTVARELFAIGILQIKEIIEYGNITPVPMTQEFISGVLNLRGSVLPVIHLAVRLGLPQQPPGKHTCIVIVELAQADREPVTLGIVVDSVNDVLTLMPTQMEPAPAFGNKIRDDFIRNIGKYRDQFITLLDLERVLAIAELSAVAFPPTVVFPPTAVFPPTVAFPPEFASAIA